MYVARCPSTIYLSLVNIYALIGYTYRFYDRISQRKRSHNVYFVSSQVGTNHFFFCHRQKQLGSAGSTDGLQSTHSHLHKEPGKRTSLFMGPNPFPPPPPIQALRHHTKATQTFVRPNAIFERLGEDIYRIFLHSKICTNLHLDSLFHYENAFRI